MRVFIKQLFEILNNKQKKQLLVIIILSLVGSMMELVGISAILPLVNMILSPEIIKTNKVYYILFDTLKMNDEREFIVFYAIVLICIYIVKNIYLLLLTNYKIDTQNKWQLDLSNQMITYYLSQNYLYYVSHNIATIQRNVVTDTGTFLNSVYAFMGGVLEGATVLSIGIFILCTDFSTAILAFCGLGILILGISKLYRKYVVELGKKGRVAGTIMTKWLYQCFEGIKEIKVTNREIFFKDHFMEALKKSSKVNIKNKKMTAYPKFIVEMMGMSGFLLIVILMICKGTDLTRTASIISAFAVAMIRLLPSFNRITEYINSIAYGKPFTEALYRSMREQKNRSINPYIAGNDETIAFEDKIEMKKLQFTYPERKEKVFANANLVIKKNQSVALIGESGAGKTTLVDILLGLLEPDTGEIIVDGKNIKDSMKAWHNTIGYIPQNIYLMDGTIRENVEFGKGKGDDNEIWEALTKAQLADYVKGLEFGLDTQIGERGVMLSGGQRQRIGIARAFYLNPEILILDEATSALDNETEAAVMQAIDQLKGKITLVIIAHRLSTIQNCDYIYEVKNGKIELSDRIK